MVIPEFIDIGTWRFEVLMVKQIIEDGQSLPSDINYPAKQIRLVACPDAASHLATAVATAAMRLARVVPIFGQVGED